MAMTESTGLLDRRFHQREKQNERKKQRKYEAKKNREMARLDFQFLEVEEIENGIVKSINVRSHINFIH